MGFGMSEAEKMLAEVFAPWVVDLGLKPIAFDSTSGRFLLPANDRLIHVGGVVCGQATAAAANTCAIVALAAVNGRFRYCSTVDLSSKFLRPLPPGDAEITAIIRSNGKRMACVQADIAASNGGKTAVTSMMTFAYMED